VTESNRNGNRGRQYIRGMTASFTHFPLDYDDEFFLCFTDDVIRKMVNFGYYDPKDPDVLEFQRNYYAADDVIANAEINGANQGESNDVASECSSKWLAPGDGEFSSISKVVEWRERNPKNPMADNNQNQRPRAGHIAAREQNLITGVTGNIAEQTEIPQNEIKEFIEVPSQPHSANFEERVQNLIAGATRSITEGAGTPQNEIMELSDFPSCDSVGDSSASSAESQIECPEIISTPVPKRINESTQTTTISEKTESSSYCNYGPTVCGVDAQKSQKTSPSSQNGSSVSLEDLQSQVKKLEDWQKEEKEKEGFFSKASNWLKNNSEVHVALTIGLAAYIVLDRRQTIVAIFK